MKGSPGAQATQPRHRSLPGFDAATGGVCSHLILFRSSKSFMLIIENVEKHEEENWNYTEPHSPEIITVDAVVHFLPLSLPFEMSLV